MSAEAHAPHDPIIELAEKVGNMHSDFQEIKGQVAELLRQPRAVSCCMPLNEENRELLDQMLVKARSDAEKARLQMEKEKARKEFFERVNRELLPKGTVAAVTALVVVGWNWWTTDVWPMLSKLIHQWLVR